MILSQKRNASLKTYVKVILGRLGIKVMRVETITNLVNDSITSLLLQQCSGVLHLGAHFGEELDSYLRRKVDVFWVEGDPDTFYKLKQEIQPLRNHKAFNVLLGAEDGVEVDFNIANNKGTSSSIFPLAVDSGFEKIGFVDKKRLVLRRLDKIFTVEELAEKDFWVLDIQGSEFDALLGAGDLVALAKYIKIEVSTYEVYRNAPLLDSIENFLNSKGFEILERPQGKYHGDVFFIRVE